MRTLLKLGVFFLLVSSAQAIAQAQTATVISTRANLRETPYQSGEVKQEVPIDTEIKVLDKKGAWYVVRIGDAVGWMHGNTFRFEDAQLRTPPTDVRTAPVNRRTLENDSSPSPVVPPTRSGRVYILGPRGGCYYYSASGNKVYVDRGLCH